MNITEYQKKLVVLINEEQIYDLKSFLNCDQNGISLEVSTLNLTLNILPEGNWEGSNIRQTFLVENPIQATKSLKEFITLWDKLEMYYLIKTIPRDDIKTNSRLFPISNRLDITGGETHILNDGMNIIANEYRKKAFIPLNDLNDFIKNNYYTQDDIIEESEKTNREQALKNARQSLKTTQISLWVTIFALIATSILQIIFSSKERDVKIINAESFKDTINVNLLNESKLEEDSVKLISPH